MNPHVAPDCDVKNSRAALVILFGLGVLLTLLKPFAGSMSPYGSSIATLLFLALAIFVIIKVARNIIIRG